MKVAYWSNCRASGVTSNLTAIGVAGVLAYPSLKITIFENHYNPNGIPNILFPKCLAKRTAEENYSYLGGGKMEPPFLRGRKKMFFRFGDYTAVEVIKNGLYYVPVLSENPDLFDYEFNCSMVPMLEKFQAEDKIAFIDTGRKNNISSNVILDSADLVVVTLRHNLQNIKNCFNNYSSFIPKAFFIIGNYDRKSCVNLRRILSEFHFKREQIGVIPHLDEFEWAANSGRIIEFLASRFDQSLGGEEGYFIQELKRTTFLMMQHAVFDRTDEYPYEC